MPYYQLIGHTWPNPSSLSYSGISSIGLGYSGANTLTYSGNND